MVNNQESLGRLMRYLLYHMKSIEIRLLYSAHNFKGDSKYRLNQSVSKSRSAIDGMCDMFKDQELARRMKKHLESVDLVYYMTLTEQLFDLKEEDLQEITDMIDDYLLKKYGSDESK